MAIHVVKIFTSLWLYKPAILLVLFAAFPFKNTPCMQVNSKVEPRSLNVKVSASPYIAFSHDHRIVVVAESNAALRLINFASGKSIGVLEGHLSQIGCAAFINDSKFMVSAAYLERGIRVWDIQSNRQVSFIRTDHCSGLAVSPDRSLLISGHTDTKNRSYLKLWKLENGSMREVHTINIDSASSSSEPTQVLRFSPSGRQLVFGNRDIFVLNVDDHRISKIDRLSSVNVEAIEFLFVNSKQLCAVFNRVGDVSFCDLSRNKELPIAKGANPSMTFTRTRSASLSPSPNAFYSVSALNAITRWDLSKTPTVVESWYLNIPKEHLRFPVTPKLSEDGVGLAVIADDILYLFDVNDVVANKKP